MDSSRNLPIFLRYEKNGDVVAHCPLLRNCGCIARSRAQALQIMQKVIQDKFTPNTFEDSTHYEVVYLAVSASCDSENRFSGRATRRSRPESPLIEIV